MGFPMAGHLADKGHNVTVYNRTTARADDWLAKHTQAQKPPPPQKPPPIKPSFALA